MKKLITLFFTFICLSVLAKSGKVMISGKVTNQTVPSIQITRIDNKEIVTAELDINGIFKISAKIESGYYFLKYGRNTAYIFLYPKDNLYLIFDAKNFQTTIAYKGKGSIRNNYLIKKSIERDNFTEDLEAFYKVDESTYLKNIQNVKESHLVLLNSFEVEKFFKKSELKSLEYQRLLSIQNYTSSYKFYLGDDISPSKAFYKPIESLRLNNEDDYMKQPYYRYLLNSIWSKRIEAAPDVDAMLKVLRKVPLRPLFISLANGFYSKISSNKERSKDYLDLIKRIATNKPFIEAAEKQYEEVLKSKGLTKGNISPNFTYESIDGTAISLTDLKGKYVYIDVWATWCAPCIKQIPYLQKLEKRYHNKNIVFVSISVDKDRVKETWKRMVNSRGLRGIQLFADKSFDSEFMNAYAVNSIPRFILINPEGKIVDAEAPRPSFEKTRVLLDQLLNSFEGDYKH